MKRWLDLLLAVGLVLLPFSTRPSESSFVISFGLPFLFLFVILYAIHYISHPLNEGKYEPPIKAAIFLALTQIYSWVYAPNLIASGARLFTNLLGLMVFFYLLSPNALPLITPVKKRRFSLVSIVVFSCTVLAGYFLLNFCYVSSVNELSRVLEQRYVGGLMSLPWGASNVIASPLIFPFFMAIYGFRNAKGITKKVFYLGCGLIMLMAIIITFSRGAQLSLAVGLLFLLFSGLFRIRNIVIAGICFVAIMVPYSEVMFYRFFNSNLDLLNGRWEIWSDYLNYIAAAPLFGRGFYSSMHLHVVSGHNIILTTLAERGITGLFFASLIHVEAARVVFSKIKTSIPSKIREFYIFAACGGIAALLHLLFEDANFSQQYMIYSWVYFAMIFTAENQFLQEEIHENKNLGYNPCQLEQRKAASDLP